MNWQTILVLTALTVILSTTGVWATTWYVNPGESIQDAIDSSTIGDMVIVSQGTYYENILFNGKNIVLTSTEPDSLVVVRNTVIDGSQPVNSLYRSGVIFDGSETTTCILTGFTIRNGTGTFGLYSEYNGGGVMGNGTHAIIRNNIIIDNSASSDFGGGGGLALCDGLIQNNIIVGNVAHSSGGALYLCDGIIQENIISGNSTVGNNYTNGGGVAICGGLIQNNIISGNSSIRDGGGLYVCHGTIQNNIITGNSSKNGGGLEGCNGTIQNNTIARNSAQYGGGLYDCDGTTVNCIIWNTIHASVSPTYSCLTDETILGTGNIYLPPLFVGNPYAASAWTIAATYDTSTYQSTLTDTSVSWEPDSLLGKFLRPDTPDALQYPVVSNTTTAIMIWGDVSGSVQASDTYEIYDYYLQIISPCIDAGDSTVDAGAYDFDGNPRVTMGFPCLCPPWVEIVTETDSSVRLTWRSPNDDSDTGTIDMGAYEYQLWRPTLFTFQSRDALNTGNWKDVYTGNSETWTDTSTAGVDKRFYRVFGE